MYIKDKDTYLHENKMYKNTIHENKPKATSIKAILTETYKILLNLYTLLSLEIDLKYSVAVEYITFDDKIQLAII